MRRNTRFNTGTKVTARTFMATTALGLTLVAGMPASATAGPDTHDKKASRAHGDGHAQRLLHFARSSDLIGAELFNASGNAVGTLDDFIVDRGSGRLVYAIVETGDVLGFGGKRVALDYGELRFNPVGTSYRTTMTGDELERRSEFLPENWEDLRTTSWMGELGDWIDGDDEADKGEESITRSVREHEPVEVEGRVVRVSRARLMGEDYVCAAVMSNDSTQREVLVAPSWFMSDEDETIRRDDEATLRVVRHGERWVALGGEINGREVEFRDSEGTPRWETDRTRQARYVLLSDLTGRAIEMNGSTVGEVQTSVVEGGSGQIVFVGLDPNENIFGLGDTVSLVPWVITGMGEDSALTLDANEAELRLAVTMPEELDSLRNTELVRSAFAAFKQEMIEFTHAEHGEKHGKQKDKASD